MCLICYIPGWGFNCNFSWFVTNLFGTKFQQENSGLLKIKPTILVVSQGKRTNKNKEYTQEENIREIKEWEQIINKKKLFPQF